MPGCRADGAGSTRSTSNSPNPHKRLQGHSPDVSNSTAQPVSTCNARPEEPLTTSDTSPPPDAALLSSLIPRPTSHQSLEVGTLVVSHQQQVIVEPQITGHFLIWALSASESNKETRSPVSSTDILHLPPIIVDSLAEKYAAYKFHDYLLHLLKDRSLPKSDVLVQRCHMLKLSVYQPWEYHKEQFIQARVRFNLVKKGSAQPDLNIRPLWLPFRDLAHAQQKAHEIDRKAMECALTFCEDASARARLSNLTPGIPFEPGIWAHQFCESHCPVKSFRPTPPPMAGRCRPTLRITTGNSSPASVKVSAPHTVNQSDNKLPSSSGDSALLDPPIHQTHDQVEDGAALNKAGASVVSSQTTKTPNVIARSISTAPALVPIPSQLDKSDLAAAQIRSPTEQLSHLSSSNVSSASRDPTQALKSQSVEDQNVDVFSLPTPTADLHTGPLPVQSFTEAALANSSNALEPMSAGISAIDSSLFSTQSGIQAGSSALLSQPSKQSVLETVSGNAKCEKTSIASPELNSTQRPEHSVQFNTLAANPIVSVAKQLPRKPSYSEPPSFISSAAHSSHVSSAPINPLVHTASNGVSNSALRNHNMPYVTPLMLVSCASSPGITSTPLSISQSHFPASRPSTTTFAFAQSPLQIVSEPQRVNSASHTLQRSSQSVHPESRARPGFANVPQPQLPMNIPVHSPAHSPVFQQGVHLASTPVHPHATQAFRAQSQPRPQYSNQSMAIPAGSLSYGTHSGQTSATLNPPYLSPRLVLGSGVKNVPAQIQQPTILLSTLSPFQQQALLDKNLADHLKMLENSYKQDVVNCQHWYQQQVAHLPRGADVQRLKTRALELLNNLPKRLDEHRAQAERSHQHFSKLIQIGHNAHRVQVKALEALEPSVNIRRLDGCQAQGHAPVVGLALEQPNEIVIELSSNTDAHAMPSAAVLAAEEPPSLVPAINMDQPIVQGLNASRQTVGPEEQERERPRKRQRSYSPTTTGGSVDQEGESSRIWSNHRANMAEELIAIGKGIDIDWGYLDASVKAGLGVDEVRLDAAGDRATDQIEIPVASGAGSSRPGLPSTAEEGEWGALDELPPVPEEEEHANGPPSPPALAPWTPDEKDMEEAEEHERKSQRRRMFLNALDSVAKKQTKIIDLLDRARLS